MIIPYFKFSAAAASAKDYSNTNTFLTGRYVSTQLFLHIILLSP
jgi:hypothetical protein